MLINYSYWTGGGATKLHLTDKKLIGVNRTYILMLLITEMAF